MSIPANNIPASGIPCGAPVKEAEAPKKTTKKKAVSEE